MTDSRSLIFGTTLFAFFVSSIAYVFPQTELQALWDLYNSTDGVYWSWKTPYSTFGSPWDFNVPNPNPCTDFWQGVNCSSNCARSQCKVTRLVLPTLNLCGSIPTDISELNALEYLDLSENQLYKTIPKEIGSLSTLSTLHLQSNMLTGGIPDNFRLLDRIVDINLNDNQLLGTLPALGQLSKLQTLSLGNNHFIDYVPSWVSQLTQLKFLNISVNFLVGKIPSTLFANGMLESCDLHRNFITGSIPSSFLGGISTLEVLNLGQNNITGEIPQSLLKFSKLSYLNLEKNKLEGTLTSEISKLSLLTYLNIKHNKFRGEIPKELSSMQALNTINFHGNRFNSSIPSELGVLSNLSVLILSNNTLRESIPTELYNLAQLTELYLGFNRLKGSLSPKIGNLTMLTHLQISDNHFKGNFPDEFSRLSRLVFVDIAHNNFTGELPSCFFQLSSLLDVNLNENRFTGSLSPDISRMVNLVNFSVAINLFHGPIPTEIVFLSNLSSLSLGANRFSGELPSELGQMTRLQYLFVDNNPIHGTIPSALGNMSSLKHLSLNFNRHTGSIPWQLGNLSELLVFDLDTNGLRGTIPSELGRLTKLRNFYVYSNFLTGTLPKELGEMSNLIDFNVIGNHLRGSIPSEYGRLSRLGSLYLSLNRFTGQIPSQIGNISTLVHLSLSLNRFTGNIFQVVKPMKHLRKLSIENNLFTGNVQALSDSFQSLIHVDCQYNLLTGSFVPLVSLPNLIELQLQSNLLTGGILFDFPTLINFDISDNFFSGCFPWNNISSSLLYLNVSSNLLSCTLPDYVQDSNIYLQLMDFSSNFIFGTIGTFLQNFNNITAVYLSSNQIGGDLHELSKGVPYLKEIDLSNNTITGSLPSALFRLQNIDSIVLSVNCISGSVPSEVCATSGLVTLVLDGMGSSEYCDTHLNSPLSKNIYYLKGQAYTTIPTCLFGGLSKLETLHLSGLGLVGTLPSAESLPKSFRYLSLSYNYFTGSIPEVYFKHIHWNEFDISFNRVSGVLSNFSATHAQLNLNINRLSGVIPDSMLHMDDINILNGNLFSCTLGKKSSEQLPSEDPNWSSYECGSNVVNLALYIWLTCFLLVVVLCVVAYRNGARWIISYDAFSDLTFDHQHVICLKIFQQISSHWLLVCFQITCFGLFVLIPIYAGLKVDYHTYQNQYAWTISAGFLKGLTPALVLYVMFLLVLGLYCKQFFVRDISTARSMRVTVNETAPDARAKACFATIVISSALVVIAINGLYVFALNQNISTDIIIVLVFALSLFKVASNNILLETPLISAEATTYVLIALLCFNNVIVPYLAELFISMNCLYYATLEPSPEVSSTITVLQCQLLFNPNTWYIEDILSYFIGPSLPFCRSVKKQINYQPPFIYSNACSSSLVANFATVFVIRYLTSAFIQPIVQFAIDKALRQKSTGNFRKVLLFFDDYRWQVIRTIETSATAQDIDEYLNRIPISMVFDHRQFASSLVTDILVLLTYGVLFPPLAVAIFVGIFLFLLDYKMSLRRMIQLSTNNSTWRNLLLRLEEEVAKTEKLMRLPVPYIAFLIAMFWSFTLFDTLGAAVGVKRAAWIMVLMSVSPVMWFGFWKLMQSESLRSRSTFFSKSSYTGSNSVDDYSMTKNFFKSSEMIQNPIRLSEMAATSQDTHNSSFSEQNAK